MKRQPRRLTGGPYAGQEMYLSTGGTLTFTAKGLTGRYNAAYTWEAVPQQTAPGLHTANKRANS